MWPPSARTSLRSQLQLHVAALSSTLCVCLDGLWVTANDQTPRSARMTEHHTTVESISTKLSLIVRGMIFATIKAKHPDSRPHPWRSPGIVLLGTMRGLMQLSIIAALIGSVACYPSDEAVHWNGPDKPFSNSVENPEYMYPVTPLPASSAREAEKGRALLSALNAGHTAQAKYTTLQQASRQGWRTQVEPNFNIAGLGLEDAFESLGISSSASSWTKIEHKHSQTGISEDGSTSYPPTNAVLSNVFNPRDGAIVTYSKIEPQEAQKQQDLPISRHELVALRTSQDMTYLAWTVLAKGDQERTNLRHIFKHDIQDERALARMKNLIDWKKYPANDQSFPTPPKV